MWLWFSSPWLPPLLPHSSARISSAPHHEAQAAESRSPAEPGTVGAPSACNLTIKHHSFCTQARSGDLGWQRGRSGQLPLLARRSRATLTTDDRAHAWQALSLALTRVCAVPNCAKSGCSLHSSTNFCHDERTLLDRTARSQSKGVERGLAAGVPESTIPLDARPTLPASIASQPPQAVSARS